MGCVESLEISASLAKPEGNFPERTQFRCHLIETEPDPHVEINPQNRFHQPGPSLCTTSRQWQL
jgi:hypothetical protein